MSTTRFSVGDALEPHTYPPFTTRQLVQYAGASGDFNELHYDRAFANAAGFDSVVVHGMLSMALCARYVELRLGASGRIRDLNARFRGVVLCGDTLTVVGTVTTVSETKWVIAVEGKRSDGASVLSGTATVVR